MGLVGKWYCLEINDENHQLVISAWHVSEELALRKGQERRLFPKNPIKAFQLGADPRILADWFKKNGFSRNDAISQVNEVGRLIIETVNGRN